MVTPTPIAAAPQVRQDGAGAARIWRALAALADPEIPVISIVELGIVRSVACTARECAITLTPTYSGCPAMRAIEDDVRAAVAPLAAAAGVALRVVTVLSPPWTTDWIAPEGRRRLRNFGIVPPGPARAERSAGPKPVSIRRIAIRCPNCGSPRTQELSRFGSTACKAQYRCADCMEPFDYFKAH